jgi:TatD DNase family protein
MKDLIDIGVSLTKDVFDADMPRIIAGARSAGVAGMIVTGVGIRESDKAAKIASNYDGVFATAGVHPHNASTWDVKSVASIESLVSSHVGKVVSIGECGLDYDRNFSPRDSQVRAFRDQLAIASALGLPVFLHERAAEEEFVQILKEFLPRLHAGAVVHCFTGGVDSLKKYLDMGLMIGITGWVADRKRGGDLRAAVKSLPLGSVMIETDSPYLFPQNAPEYSVRKVDGRKINEPKMLPYVLTALAEAMEVPAEELARSSTENAERFFKI